MSPRTVAAVAVVAATLGTWTLAVSQSPDAKKKPDAKAELMDADRAFAAAADKDGLDGWMGFMADDAVRIQPLGGKATVGKAAVKELDAALFADPKKLLVWEPTDGGAFAEGKTGWTTGQGQFITRGEKVDPANWSTTYVTIWRKGDDGKWKVILDTGAAVPKK